MNKKMIKYILGLALLILIGYNSIYFKKLDEVKASLAKTFDAKTYARKYLDTLLPLSSSAPDIEQLLKELKSDKENTFSKYSHSLGIGNIRYFLVKGEVLISGINENEVIVLSAIDTSGNTFRIATEFIYGNTIRDASGFISLNDFNNTSDLNAVSEEINKIIRKEVIPQFKAVAKENDTVQFFGAIELNRNHEAPDSIEIIPISLKLLSK